MKGVEVGRYYLPEIDKVFITYMCDPKQAEQYDNDADDIPASCPTCDEYDTFIKIDNKIICQGCGYQHEP
jgi:hypothetical protein